MEHVVAVFDTAAEAESAIAALRSGGFADTAIRRYNPGDTGAPTMTRTGTATGTAFSENPSPTVDQPYRSGGFWSWLMGEEEGHVATHEDRAMYEEHISAGRTIVSISALTVDEASRAMRILETRSPAELETQHDDTTSATRTETVVEQPTANVQPTQPTGTIPMADRTTDTLRTTETGREEVIPLAEEQLDVSKRMVDRGITRIRRYTVERPAEQDVSLREERTVIERRAASGVAGAEAFTDKTVEVHEQGEEPVVGKTARIVEEAVVHKESGERTETVHGTVRKEEISEDRTGERSERTEDRAILPHGPRDETIDPDVTKPRRTERG